MRRAAGLCATITDIEIPPALNGAQVLVNVPAGVQARYGECPSEERWHEGTPARFDNCVMVMEVPVPTVVTTPELDLRSVAEFGLQLSGMSANQAHLFSQTVDWTSTLAIPVPRNASSYDSVTVDGVKGLLIAGLADRHANLPPAYGLLWVKNGVMYSVAGFGDSGMALPLAASLR